MKIILLIMQLMFILSSGISNSYKASRDGLSVMVNAGTMSGGIGLVAQYQFRLDMFTFLVPFAGTGIEPAPDVTGFWQGYATGLNIEHGKYHRIFGGASFGTKGIGYESNGIEVVNKHQLRGVSLLGGYKGLKPAGFIWHINIGWSYMKNPVASERKYYKGPTAGIGLGYKF